VDKLWQRVFFESGALVRGNNEYSFSPEVVSSHSLSEMLSTMLRPEFERLYPQHPRFARTLEEDDALQVTKQLFGGSPASGPDIESQISDIALPLGLVKEVEGSLVPLSEEEFTQLPVIKDALAAAASAGTDMISTQSLNAAMGKSPYGLTSEAQHLLLSALVAQKHFEFVTSSGNRIHYRSLDLQIDWNDVVGISRPAAQAYSNERLFIWAATLTGDNTLTDAKSPETRAKTIAALEQWLTDWKCNAVIARFDELPDEALNSTFWRLANGVRKSFGAVSEYIEELVRDRGSLDACLQNIADTFADSEKEFENKLKDLAILGHTLDVLPEFNRIRNYVLQAEYTGDQKTDAIRNELMSALSRPVPQEPGAVAMLMEKAKLFMDGFRTIYIAKHNALMDTAVTRGRLDEFMASDLWTLFSGLSVLPVFDAEDMDQATQTIRAIRNLECKADVNAVLETQPVCVCGFVISHGSESNILINKLSSIVANSLKRIMQLLVANGAILQPTVGGEVLKSFDDAVHGRGGIPALSGKHIRLLKIATEGLAVSDRNVIIEPHPFESLGDALLENELGRLESSA
jgi:hypothetical protein